MSEFGIYFGTRIINITEVKGKKALVNISIPQERIINPELEQKNPDEAQIVNALKGEFAKNEISPSNVSIALPAEDIIVRTFDLPIFLSKKELDYSTIAFEAKKYIPFKIEDIVFDFRLYRDRKDKKNLVLFVGIKKEILNRYLSIFKQLQIRIRLIEYAGFSIMRLLKLGGIKDTGVIGLLNVDLEEETNFLVCQNGFSLFSRDINLFPRSEGETESAFIEKLKSEIRISLDFFRRKFPTKSLEKVIVLSLPQYQTEIAALIKNLGLSTTPLVISKFLGRDLEFSGTLAKSYAVAISNIQRSRFPMDLLKPAMKKEEGLPGQALPVAIAAIRIKPKVVLLASLIILLSVGWGLIRRLPLENELKIIGVVQPKIEGISGQQSFASLANLEREYIDKRDVMEGVVRNRFYLTKAMDVIPRLMPSGTWLTSFSFQSLSGKLEFNLEGLVSLADPDEEFAAVNDIVSGLKNDPNFNQYFKVINVVSMERIELTKPKLEVTKFAILCR